jgi:hypothetical protein
MRSLFLTVLLMFAVPAGAADRTAKIQALMEAQGLLQMWDQQMELGKEESRKQAQQLIDQMLSSITPTPELEAHLRSALDEFMKALEPSWTAQDIVAVWADNYGVQFTDQELDGLLAYYTSPLGKKDVAAAQAALPTFMNHFMELSKPLMESATQTYIQRLQDATKGAKAKSQ